MEKLTALLNKLMKSATAWVTVVLGVISYIEPVLQTLEQVVGTLSPSKAILLTAALAFIARLRSLLGGVTPPPAK